LVALKTERRTDPNIAEVMRRSISDSLSLDANAQERAMRFFDGMWEHHDSARRWDREDRIALLRVVGEELGFKVEMRCPRGLENVSPASEHIMFSQEAAGLPEPKKLEKLVELLGMLPDPYLDRTRIVARRNGDADAELATTFSELVGDVLTRISVKLIDADEQAYGRVKERVEYLRNVALYQITKME
jgi:hypothetical protein